MKSSKTQLPFGDWPPEDRSSLEAAFRPGEFLDEQGAGAHLAHTSRAALKAAYGHFLGFLAGRHPHVLALPMAERVDQKIIAAYVEELRQTRRDSSIVTQLHHIRLALKLLCPDISWSWLHTITKRIDAQARRKPQRHHLVTIERLYALGLELMNGALKDSDQTASISKTTAFQYRDGVLIALLAAVLPRRGTLASLRIGTHLLKSGNAWALDIPATDTKTRQAQEFPLAPALSDCIDVYLKSFRARIPGANAHDGLWPSNKGRPMDDGTIYDMVCRRTRAAFGFAVNLHRFRHAAVTLWSVQDPKNVRGTKDLLGHASFVMTEKYYSMSQSRVAGRSLAQAITSALAKKPG
jgi:site-specific recombinase XerD